MRTISTILLTLLVTMPVMAQQTSDSLFASWLDEQALVIERSPVYQFREESNRTLQSRSGERNFDLVTFYNVDLRIPTFTFDLSSVSIDGRQVPTPDRSQLRRGVIEPVTRLLTEIPSFLSAVSMANMEVAGPISADSLRGFGESRRIKLLPKDERHPIANVLLWFDPSENRVVAARIAFRNLPPRRTRGRRSDRPKKMRPPRLFARFERVEGLDLPVGVRVRGIVPAQIRGRTTHIQLTQTSRYFDYTFGE